MSKSSRRTKAELVVIGEDEFSKELAKALDAEFLLMETTVFNDNEVKPKIKMVSSEVIKGKNVLLVSHSQRFNPHPNRDSVKNILALSILKSNKAKKIDMLIPYMVYARQDKVFQIGEPLSIAVLANIYDGFGVSNIYTIASHLYGKDETTKTHRTLRSFFKTHVHDISPIKLFADYLKNISCIVDPFIIVPDEGGRRIGCELADALKCRWGYFKKARDPATGKILEMAPANMKPEDVNGKSVVILDDVTASGSTIEEAHLKTNEYFKPKEEYAAVGHVINETTVNKLYNCGFKEVLTTDSLATSPYTSVEYKKNELSFSKQKYFTEISVAGLLEDYIKSTSKT